MGKVPCTAQLRSRGKDLQPLDGKPDKVLNNSRVDCHPEPIYDGEGDEAGRGWDIRRKPHPEKWRGTLEFRAD